MPRSLRQFVRDRAGCRCEYCHIPDFAVSVPVSTSNLSTIPGESSLGKESCSIEIGRKTDYPSIIQKDRKRILSIREK